MDCLENFNFALKHKDSSSNKVFEALSKKYNLLITLSYEIVGFDLILKNYVADPFFSKVLQKLNEKNIGDYTLMNDYVLKENIFIYPKVFLQIFVMRELHYAELGGHFGCDKIKTLVRKIDILLA